MSEVLIGVVIGLLLGMGVAYLYIAYRVNNLLKNLDQHIDRAMESTMVAAVVEKEQDMYYCYREDDNKFLAQGKSLLELRDIFKATMPDKTVYINGGNEVAVEELRKQTLEFKE